jgi:hypothetical protein
MRTVQVKGVSQNMPGCHIPKNAYKILVGKRTHIMTPSGGPATILLRTDVNCSPDWVLTSQRAAMQ